MPVIDSRAVAAPRSAFVFAVIQHFGLAVVTLAVPRLVAQAAGADDVTVENYVQISMVALGIATLLQAWNWRGIGSGYLLPACFSGIYVAPAVAVATAEGLGAVAGLAIVAGLTQVLLSRFLRHFRSFIPPDVVGVGIVMIGLSWGILGLKLICGISVGQESPLLEWITGVIALAAMVTVSVWGRKTLKPLSVFIGLSAGCIAAVVLYLLLGDRAITLPAQAFVMPRWPLFEISFTTSYLPGFMIGAITSFLRVTGDVIASHQVSDINWKRPNTRSVAAGGLAEGLGNIVSGLIGALPVNTSSGSVGLVAASGVASRNIAIGVGLLWIVMAILPFGVALLLLIPAAVQGAAVFYTAGFVMRSGFTMLTQRMIDNRRAITIGSALIIGIAFDDVMRGLKLAPEFKDAFTSPLLACVATAVLLAALFRIGVKRSVGIAWDPDRGDRPLHDWISASGKLWVARTQLIERAEAVLEDFAQAAPHLTRRPVQVTAHYDEISLTLEMTWKGAAALAAAPAAGLTDIDMDEDAVAVQLAMALVRRIADHVSETILPDGSHRLTVTLDDL
jgi:xanthine/uracil permease